MGELYRVKSTIISIKSNDHEPAHVHVVIRSEKIHFRVFIDSLKIEYIKSKQLSASDEKLIREYIKQRRAHIQEEWNEIQKDQKK